MRERHFLLAAVSAVLTIAASAPTLADDNGLANIHVLERVGSKTCFSGHTHYGDSVGKSSRNAAMAEAVKGWRSFVDFEYGSDWASYVKAHARHAACSKAGGSWACSVEGNPCK